MTSDDPRSPSESAEATASYVFRAQVRLDPEREDVRVDPRTVQITIERAADPPGEPGWRFFRDNLWRGDLADPAHFRQLTGDAIGIPVESVTFSELRAQEGYLTALRESIAADLESFKAETVDEVLSKYLGSSIRVTDD